ncbi:hypothetical protein TrST_g8768 [Triparma strigata]|uniref:FAD-binding FR-type domain-containing protein n=1 Tax=Triparma strigata TaxID=1606541 RepID=A0A9W7AKE4_9STRA|nr:hypothetical protein TrST_g8768 [Triparma strigata]
MAFFSWFASQSSRLLGRWRDKQSKPAPSSKFEARPASLLPGTAILLFLNAAYILYKSDYYELYDRDDPSTVYKIAGNTLGKIGTINFGLFLIPVSTFSPVLAALSLSQEVAYAFHRSAAILAVLQIVAHGVLHTLGYYYTRAETETESGAPTFVEWTVWPASVCYGEEAEGPEYECHACSCYHTKANVVGFWSAVFMLLICFTSTPQIRRNWYKLFYWCHVLFAVPALVLMMMHWSGMVGYFLPSLIIWGLSKSLQVFELVSIRLRGGSKFVANLRVRNINVAEITLPTSGASFVPGQFVRLSIISKGWNLSMLEPSHPYTIASAPSSNFVKVIYASDTNFGRRLAQLGNEDKTSLLVCRGYFGPNDRYDRILACALTPPDQSSPSSKVMIVAGGIGCTPYLAMLSQLVLDMPENKRVSNVEFCLVCRGTGLLEHLKPTLNEYVKAGIVVTVHVTPERTAAYTPVDNSKDLELLMGTSQALAQGVSDGFKSNGEVCVNPHPLMPGVARPDGFMKSVISSIVAPLFWLSYFYASLKLCFYYTEDVQSHHIVESRIFLPLALTGFWVVLGAFFNVPVITRALWGRAAERIPTPNADARTPGLEFKSDPSPTNTTQVNNARARFRSLSIEKDLIENPRSVKEIEGRPVLDDKLKGFKGDVYICGPEALKEDVRRSCGVPLPSVCTTPQKQQKSKKSSTLVLGRCGVRVWEEIFEW